MGSESHPWGSLNLQGHRGTALLAHLGDGRSRSRSRSRSRTLFAAVQVYSPWSSYWRLSRVREGPEPLEVTPREEVCCHVREGGGEPAPGERVWDREE